MKFSFFLVSITLVSFISCSQLNPQRSPASLETFDSVIQSDEKQPCGLSGSIAERILDCKRIEPSKHPGFNLVTRTTELKEVHLELDSGLLWGDAFVPESLSQKNAKLACIAGIAEVGYITEGKWRLPSAKEYKSAHHNGIVDALPNMNDFFWSSDVSILKLHGWLFYAYQERYYHFVGTNVFRSNKHNARCVAKNNID